MRAQGTRAHAENDSGHLVVPPKAGSWEKACAHAHECTQTRHTHTHTTQHATYTTGTPARRVLVRYRFEIATRAQTRALTQGATPCES